MTGRFAHSIGLNFAILHGSAAGLPDNVTTIPQVLGHERYTRHMNGKWHLGAARPIQLPVSRGFDTFEGNLLYNLDSWTKRVPWIPGQPDPRDWAAWTTEAPPPSHLAAVQPVIDEREHVTDAT